MSDPQEFLDVFAEYATDEKAEVEGVWRDLGKKARVKVARANNVAYGRMLNKLADEHGDKLLGDSPEADALNMEVMLTVMASTILTGFEGLGYQGKPITYSVENAKKLLAHSDFRNRIDVMSRDVQRYKAKQEEDQGNA